MRLTPRQAVYAFAAVLVVGGLILHSGWGLLVAAAGGFIFIIANPRMALNCPHCGRWVASFSTTCGHCGRDIQTGRRG